MRNAIQRFLRSTTVTQFFSVTFWSLFGSIITNGAGLVLSVFVARLLGKQFFGQFVALQTLVVLGTAICWYGIGFVVTRYCAELRQRDTARLGRILGLTFSAALGVGVVAFLLIFVFADALAAELLKAPELSAPLRIVSISIVLNALDGFNKNALIGFSELRAFAFGSIGGIAINFPMTLLLAYFYGLDGAATGLSVAAFVNALISHIQARRALKKYGVKIDFKSFWTERKLLTGFALPGLIVAVLPTFSTWLCQIFLLKEAHGYAEVAIFGIAMQWFHIVNFLPASASRAIMPMLTDAVADKDHLKSHRIFLLGIFAYVAAALPVALGGAVLAGLIVQGYGADFSGTELALRIAMLAGVINAAQSPVQNLIAAKSEMWIAASMAVVQAFIYVSLALYMISHGAVGVAIAFATAYLLVSLWSLFYGWSHFYGEVKNN